MVNQVRTLLLNEAAAAVPGPGEEYVPAAYRPVRLPANLRAARAALFGKAPDRTSLNLTLARVLAVLHASRFAADVTAADPRITYDPRLPADVWALRGAYATTITGAAPVGWGGAGSFLSPERAYGSWAVTTTGTGGYSLTTADVVTVSGNVVASTLGDAVPLPGSNLLLVVPAAAAGRWEVTLLVPPVFNWVGAAAAEGAGVFSPSTSAADRRWFAAWSDPNEPAPVRAAALALALAARTGELYATGA